MFGRKGLLNMPAECLQENSGHGIEVVKDHLS